MTTAAIDANSVVHAVQDIVPRLRENGRQAEEERWIPQENIDLLEKAGVFRIATPGRFGGLDLPVAEQTKILAEIARGCPSTGWVASVWVSSTWLATLFPDRAQEEIFAQPSVRVSGGFTPTGTLTPTEGGYVLNGSWRFNTGCRGADWNIAATILENPDGTHAEVIAIVPMSEFTIADDWHTSAASATGSSTSTAKDVFVPAHRVVDFGEAIFNATPDRSNTGANGRNYGLFAFVMAETVATFLGTAQGALELFLERIPGRAIAYTSWENQAEHPLTQIKVAEAANKIAAAQALEAVWLKVLQDRADAGEQPTTEEKATIRGQGAYAIQLAKEAVEILYRTSGASVIQRSVPLQRFFRDVEGFSLHGFLLLSTNLELHGRVLLGLDPDTPLL
ncbi:acyl-CoA dehydrogenase [Streptomyces spinoverrucosus]|uniref:Acyl-CoA dehydrogenase n=1 Tax=Streptomyces spinoverrucosus TaxID=284043 RepID=A0A4Y3VQS4_9ACTN|nr:acyl-CoA dehydrogenase family protein [Streptomyces spinoverrucosus]GEC08101.1 acyl-CoA dehydrogenase [Streptomyces spinoverrucosus]GHB64796.1 acyl-CoA dehydrogenase [Streptomyces spinoverrucosus]